jgi:hypothetical protein
MGRIVVMSDTMISNADAPRPNRIPGRLKSVVINRWLTVSYAGLSAQALDAIRMVARDQRLTTDATVTKLCDEARRLSGKVDFLVCSHEEEEHPRLVKIADGKVFEGHDLYWIGNQNSATNLSRLELVPIKGESGSDYYSLEERLFTRRFHTYLEKTQDESVGGMVINCLASPLGHCYQDHLGAYVERITIPDPLAPELRAEMNKAGMNGYYKYAVLTGPHRGVAIVGVYFEQAGVGFVHDPLACDDPQRVPARTQREFHAAVAARSQARAESSNAG